MPPVAQAPMSFELPIASVYPRAAGKPLRLFPVALTLINKILFSTAR